MTKKQLEQLIREELKKTLTKENQPLTKPKPGTKEKESEPKPKPKRTLQPGKDAPDNAPHKAEGAIDKIAKRYKDLNK
jgi:hypothetical protein